MSDEQWILTLYRRYVELYGEPTRPTAVNPASFPVNNA